jgi:alpha-tubulin suppressor-like RCC1 family protein
VLLAANLVACGAEAPVARPAAPRLPGVPPRAALSAGAASAASAAAALPAPGPIVALTPRCALVRDGRVRCWEPAPGVAELTDAVALAGDARQVWAIDRAGAAHCANCKQEALDAIRALGPLTAIAVRDEIVVRTALGAVFLYAKNKAELVAVPPAPVGLEAAAGRHQCALYASGRIYCWGYNGDGQLGHRGPVGEPSTLGPTPVGFLSDAISVSGALFHSCAVHRGGGVTCWGYDIAHKGTLGRTQRTLFEAVDVPGIDDAVEVDSGFYTTCAVRRSGRVSCWGPSEAFAFSEASRGPFDLDLENVEHVAVTERAVCVAERSGAVQCLGDLAAKIPMPPVGVAGATAVAASESGSCALVGQGELWCWGAWERRISQGETETKLERTPRLVHDVRDAVALAMSKTSGRSYDGCVARRSGRVACWLGPWLTDPGVSDAVGVAVGHHHACALRTGGTVSCWGSNEGRQLGREGDYSEHATEVAGVKGAVALGCGGDASCVLDPKGALLCWGSNDSSLLADGQTVRQSTRPRTGRLADAVELAVGQHHACAVKRDGHVACWGFNGWREVNFTSVQQQPKPVVYPGIDEVAHVRLGSMRSCVLRRPGSLKCWGWGQADIDAVFPDKSREVPMPGVVDVAIGDSHACVLTATGAVLCWGDDAKGQLGQGGGAYGVRQVLAAEPP